MIYINRIFLIVVLLGLVLIGCSSSTKNQINHNQFSIREGSYKNKKWSDDLVFKRTSWFQEISMLFDVLASEINSSSPFFEWFSDFEKSEIHKCGHFVLILSYRLTDTRLSDGMFVGELKKLGYQMIEIPHFKDNLKLHPDYLNELLEHYKVRGACRTTQESSGLLISLPGYAPVNII
ncbi:MAG: hypothetical protein A2381_07570 [Bdellovibrionales bacterium RIFOXYB1_FULL_37_110]|nr:MAG: hypothetical protein A2181_04335 [Bdellovibrionales bacterium RIFOXYA1_FULL_38_20]OFZ52466.1 MAG: hypothetical protein A2417_00290 [Bdellovibrionales bacterium RIFOXYC1_FULL_37_79]OFZ59668.1 MAG: hypothetical protein A2381_07570 [Bdellovibrionales bacterium RIFOXYB1_FULL_37_110]OFZ62595.1 MAG: hypothetical protein A2577_11890 [Bdellovibrionales bacterium RIFOXYD1_FULL_36_51]